MRRIEHATLEISAQDNERADEGPQREADQQGGEEEGAQASGSALDQAPRRQGEISTPEVDEEAAPADPMPALSEEAAARRVAALLREDPRRPEGPAADELQGGEQVRDPQGQQQDDMEVDNVWAGLT